MATPSLYRSLPVEQRQSLLERLIKADKANRALFVARLASLPGGFRPVTLQSWPADKLAKEVIRRNAERPEDEMDLLRALYIEVQPEVQIAFLDTAGVKRDGANIHESVEPPYCDAESVKRAAALVQEEFGDLGRHYLRTIAKYNNEGWPGIDEIVAALPG